MAKNQALKGQTNIQSSHVTMGESGKTNPLDDILGAQTDEICIVLCGPIGSPFQSVVDSMREILQTQFGYDVNEYRLSSFIRRYNKGLDTSTAFAEANSLISAGNSMRDEFGESILAELAVREIAKYREGKKPTASERHKSIRAAYIVNSIKNPAELQLLKSIYLESLFLIGVYSSFEDRRDRLQRPNGLDLSQIHQLVDRDSGEELQYGQSVRRIFPRADYFISGDYKSSAPIEVQCERFLRLCFRTNISTPSVLETGMYAAHSASLKSACLSRQVGASIVNVNTGNVIATGWNDVPKFGGGLYQSNDEQSDNRCFMRPEKLCHNDFEKSTIIAEIAESIRNIPETKELSKDKLIQILKASRISDLIEFSRAVHAEMLAILNAPNSLQQTDHILFTTTYPCHNCARHIVAAGIKTVYYIEPYKKSLAIRLHSDSITESENDNGKVQIRQFHGVAPSRFPDFFLAPASSRKQDGRYAQTPRSEARPAVPVHLESIPVFEGIVVKRLEEKQIHEPS